MYTPDVILGVYSADELEDNRPAMRDINRAPVVNIAEKYNAKDVEEIVDTETGEIIEVDEVLVAEIRDKMELSENKAQLNKLAQELKVLPDSKEKTELRELYKSKIKGFDNGK